MSPAQPMRATGGSDSFMSQVFTRVYGWMFAGLAITALTSIGVASNQAAIGLVFNNGIVTTCLFIFEIILVFSIAAAIRRISSTTATILFVLYSFLNGITLSLIVLAYTASSIGLAFAAAAGMFGVMAFYGYATKQDLSRLGSVLMMALFGIIIASLGNLFFGSDALSFILSILSIIVFSGLTAYDNQKIKQMAASMAGDDEGLSKLAIVGALQLYLDLINLVLDMLSISGKRR